jgi:hypothetical protein
MKIKQNQTGAIYARAIALCERANKVYALFILMLLSSPLFAQPNLSSSDASATASDAGIQPLYQKIYNIGSVLVTLAALIFVLKPIKGLFSSEAGAQSQDGERKGHLIQLGSIAMGLVIWFFGIPALLKLGFK